MGACNSAKTKEIKGNDPNKNEENKNEEKKSEEKKSEEKSEEKKEEKNEEKKSETLNLNKNEEEKKEEEKNLNFNTKSKINFFTTNTSLLQTQNLKYFQSKNSKENGEHIVMSFCDTFDIVDNFFYTLYYEHKLETKNPIYDYNKFFHFDNQTNTYKARAIAVNIPNSQYETFTNSKIIDLYNKDNIIHKNQTQNLNDLKNFSENEEKKNDFIINFNNDNYASSLNNLLRTEVEKCDNLRCIHFLGNIFNGESDGLLSSFLFEIQNDYNNVLRMTHLKYFDTYTHKAFNKIKNYIFTISYIYDKCSLINFFNTPFHADTLVNLTLGERIKEFYSDYNLNKILSDLLIDPAANFVYSNGCKINKPNSLDYYFDFLFADCKENYSRSFVNTQISSLCIYKGNKILTEDEKIILSNKMSKVVDLRLKNNKMYYNFYNINKEFQYDFIANFHQTNYFKDFTEEYFMNFIQNYNISNFTKEEKENRNEAIMKVNDIMNYYKEIWKLVK